MIKMATFSTPAILLRRLDYGDHDLIITFITLDRGKITVIAKHAKKSKKRFSGILELFSGLHMVCTTGRGRGLPVLQEAVLEAPFPEIRTDIIKTAYASYWAELIARWLEEGQKQTALYYLLQHVLHALDASQRKGSLPMEVLSVLFQMKFMKLSGHSPNLRECSVCRIGTDHMKRNPVVFDLSKGGVVCERCGSEAPGGIRLAKGTIKQLLWLENQDLEKALRVRFASAALREGLQFLEVFVPFHLGIEPRSLRFLRKIS